MTFAVAARTGTQVGVAGATARPAMGGRCLVGRPGHGVAATQGIVSTRLGYAALDAVASGATAGVALRDALVADPAAADRQVVVVTGAGDPAAHTGEAVTRPAGHRLGADHAVAGNTLAGEAVLDAMSAALDASGGDLAERLVAALVAGDAAGGDRRGRQSAALLVVGADPWPAVDLRVDDHPSPVTELVRLLAGWREVWDVYDRTGTFPPANPPGRAHAE